jgi:hypothetical protein
MDLREYLNKFDEEERGWLPTERFFSLLERDPINLSSLLNEQEILTLKRSYSSSPSDSTNQDRYFHHELCDLLSKRFYLHRVRTGDDDYPRARAAPWSSSGSNASGSRRNSSSSSLLPRYLTELRSRSVLWRRLSPLPLLTFTLVSLFRQSPESIGLYLPLAQIVEMLEVNGCHLSSAVIGELVSQYSLPQQEANTILQVDPPPPLGLSSDSSSSGERSTPK